MKKIYYLFRRPVLKDLALAKKNNYPKDFFYGYAEISNKLDLNVCDSPENSKFIKTLHNLSNKYFINSFKHSFSVLPVIAQIKNISLCDIIFATVDSYGLACAYLKSMGLFKKQKIVFNTIGLCDVLSENKNLNIKFYRKILSFVEIFISGASNKECRKMAQLLNFPKYRFIHIPFGIDTEFFNNNKVIQKGYCLVIGADRKRDWDLYHRIFNQFPKINFKIITHRGMYTYPKSSNIDLLYNLPISKVKQYISECNFALILSKQNYHFAGQSTVFRIMSIRKPVIFTDSWGVDEYNFINEKECFLVKPGDEDMIVKYINKIIKNNNIRKKIGYAARKKIVNDLNIIDYSKKLEYLFNRI